jgi:predicted phage tail component-like protein
MANGYLVTYGGVASSALTGFWCHEVSRDLVAARRTSYETVPGMEGSYVIPEEPGMRKLEIDASIMIPVVDKEARRAAVREVAAWYNRPRPAKLIIDDEPDLYEMAVPESAPNVREWRQRGSFKLPFLCEPYTYESTLQHITAVAGAALTNVVVPNDGDVWTPLIVQIQAAGTSAGQAIEIGSRQWQRNTSMTAGQFVTFNTKAGVITNVANTDTDLQGVFDPANVSMVNAAGRPPYLEPGNNTLEIIMATSGYTYHVWWRNRFS